MNAIVAAFPRPGIRREHLRLLNALGSASGRIRMPLAGKSYRVHFPVEFASPYLPRIEVRLRIGDKQIVLDSDRMPRPQYLEGFLGGIEDSRFGAEMIAALLESLIADLQPGLESAIGCGIAVDMAIPYGSLSVSSDRENAHLLLEPEAGGESIRLRITLDADAVGLLENWAVRATKQPGKLREDLDIPLTFIAAVVKLPASVIRGLESGDVVFIDTDPRRKGGIKVATEGLTRAVCMATWDDRRIIAEEMMKMDNNIGLNGPGAGADPLADLELEMEFRLGRRTIALGELREISQGHVFLLPENPEGLVEIRINGRLLGSGMLVDVSGRAGVLIERLATDVPKKTESEAEAFAKGEPQAETQAPLDAAGEQFHPEPVPAGIPGQKAQPEAVGGGYHGNA